VIILAVNAPHRLQLQPVTAQEFMQIERLELGDSNTPTRVELVVPQDETRIVAIEGQVDEMKATDQSEPEGDLG